MRIFAILSLIFIFNGCKSNGCKKFTDINKGLIESDYSFGGCQFFIKLDSHLIVRTQAEFTDIVNRDMGNCSSKNNIPAIDFSKNSLIALSTATYACDLGTERDLSKNESAKTFTYTVNLSKCEGCNYFIRKGNFVLTPLIPSDYKVIWVKKGE